MSQHRSAPPTLLLGQAGVWQVASQLALRGLNPHVPGVDHGYDLLVDGGLRIQVKATRMRYQKRVYPGGAYWFKLTRSAYAKGNNTLVRSGPRDYAATCDFVVLWGVEENRFWIVPGAVMGKCQGVVLGPKGFHERQSFDEARALSAAGFNQREIGERLGITQAAVSYQLRGGRKKQPKQTMTAIVRAHEDRWDLITGALATLHEAQTVVAPLAADPAPDMPGGSR